MITLKPCERMRLRDFNTARNGGEIKGTYIDVLLHHHRQRLVDKPRELVNCPLLLQCVMQWRAVLGYIRHDTSTHVTTSRARLRTVVPIAAARAYSSSSSALRAPREHRADVSEQLKRELIHLSTSVLQRRHHCMQRQLCLTTTHIEKEKHIQRVKCAAPPEYIGITKPMRHMQSMASAMQPWIPHLEEVHSVPIARRRDAEAVLALQYRELPRAYAHEHAHIRSRRVVEELAPAAIGHRSFQRNVLPFSNHFEILYPVKSDPYRKRKDSERVAPVFENQSTRAENGRRGNSFVSAIHGGARDGGRQQVRVVRTKERLVLLLVATIADLVVCCSDVFQAEFAELYASKIVHKRHGDSSLQASLSALEALQREYVDKQVKQNVFDKIIQIETTEELQSAIAAPTQVHAAFQRSEQELEVALQERKQWLQRIEATVREIEREKRNVAEQDSVRPAFESELERLTNEWKEFQKQNAQRRAAIQMATSVMINDEDDCTRVLDQQTQSIQELMEKQKQLVDKKLDINAQVQQTQQKIASLTKKNDMRSKDMAAKQREEDFFTLQRMKQWYEDMKRISAQISGLEISHISNEFMEVSVLKTHSLRFFYDSDSLRVRHVELLQPDIAANDLVAMMLRDNDLQFFLCEYRDRVRNLTLSAYATASTRG